MKDVASPVPLHLRNAPTSLMKGLGYGKGYKYAHDEAGGVAEDELSARRISKGGGTTSRRNAGVEVRLKEALEKARSASEERLAIGY